MARTKNPFSFSDETLLTKKALSVSPESAAALRAGLKTHTLPGALGGAAAGAIGGYLTGDDDDNRLRRALAGGVAGGALGGLAGTAIGHGSPGKFAPVPSPRAPAARAVPAVPAAAEAAVPAAEAAARPPTAAHPAVSAPAPAARPPTAAHPAVSAPTPAAPPVERAPTAARPAVAAPESAAPAPAERAPTAARPAAPSPSASVSGSTAPVDRTLVDRPEPVDRTLVDRPAAGGASPAMRTMAARPGARVAPPTAEATAVSPPPDMGKSKSGRKGRRVSFGKEVMEAPYHTDPATRGQLEQHLDNTIFKEFPELKGHSRESLLAAVDKSRNDAQQRVHDAVFSHLTGDLSKARDSELALVNKTYPKPRQAKQRDAEIAQIQQKYDALMAPHHERAKNIAVGYHVDDLQFKNDMERFQQMRNHPEFAAALSYMPSSSVERKVAFSLPGALMGTGAGMAAGYLTRGDDTSLRNVLVGGAAGGLLGGAGGLLGAQLERGMASAAPAAAEAARVAPAAAEAAKMDRQVADVLNKPSVPANRFQDPFAAGDAFFVRPPTAPHDPMGSKKLLDPNLTRPFTEDELRHWSDTLKQRGEDIRPLFSSPYAIRDIAAEAARFRPVAAPVTAAPAAVSPAAVAAAANPAETRFAPVASPAAPVVREKAPTSADWGIPHDPEEELKTRKMMERYRQVLTHGVRQASAAGYPKIAFSLPGALMGTGAGMAAGYLSGNDDTHLRNALIGGAAGGLLGGAGGMLGAQRAMASAAPAAAEAARAAPAAVEATRVAPAAAEAARVAPAAAESARFAPVTAPAAPLAVAASAVPPKVESFFREFPELRDERFHRPSDIDSFKNIELARRKAHSRIHADYYERTFKEINDRHELAEKSIRDAAFKEQRKLTPVEMERIVGLRMERQKRLLYLNIDANMHAVNAADTDPRFRRHVKMITHPHFDEVAEWVHLNPDAAKTAAYPKIAFSINPESIAAVRSGLKSHALPGALIGAGAGAAGGYLAGDDDNRLRNALIGGAAGGALGGLTGAAVSHGWRNPFSPAAAEVAAASPAHVAPVAAPSKAVVSPSKAVAESAEPVLTGPPPGTVPHPDFFEAYPEFRGMDRAAAVDHIKGMQKALHDEAVLSHKDMIDKAMAARDAEILRINDIDDAAERSRRINEITNKHNASVEKMLQEQKPFIENYVANHAINKRLQEIRNHPQFRQAMSSLPVPGAVKQSSLANFNYFIPHAAYAQSVADASRRFPW